MAKDARLAGSEFLRETLTLLPAEKRPALEALLSDADAAAALTRLGEGTLRQSDYDRQMNEAKAAKQTADQLYESNTNWFNEQKANLTELDKLRGQLAAGELKPATGDGTGTPNPNPPKPPDGLTREQFAAEIDKLERGAVGFMDELTDLKLQHYRDFNEVLDARALLADKRIQQIGIKGVYQEVHREKLTARSAAATAAAEEAIRKDEREKLLKAANGQHIPYSVRGNEPSTLDGLEAAAGKPVAAPSVDDMTAEYARLGAARGA